MPEVAVNTPVENDPGSDRFVPYDVFVPYSKPRVVAFAPPVAVMLPLNVAPVAVTPEVVGIARVGATVGGAVGVTVGVGVGQAEVVNV
jgi:hypothetical protein